MKKLIAILAMTALISFTPNPNEEKPITVTLTLPQWEIVLQGLGELPMKTAAPISQSIIQQAQKQLTDTLPKKK
jgi:hypothetical protein